MISLFGRSVRNGVVVGFSNEGYPVNTAVYGGIYCRNNGAGEATVTGAFTTLVTCYTTNMTSVGVTASESAGTLTIAAGAGGLFDINCELGGITGTLGKNFDFEIFKNGVSMTHGDGVYINGAAEPRSVSISFPAVLVAGDVLTVRKRGTDGTPGTAITVANARFWVGRRGGVP